MNFLPLENPLIYESSDNSKILLMGKSKSGKSSMRAVIFSNYVAKDTRRMAATIDVESSHVRLLGNLLINMWDCGGQDIYKENYLELNKGTIFKNAEIMVYLFDVVNFDEKTDIYQYKKVMSLLWQISPKARVYCCIHKMDLIPDEQKDLVFQNFVRLLNRKVVDNGQNVNYFPTSIFDESVFATWSEIISNMVPNIKSYQENIYALGELLNARELVLFEKMTFLIISYYSNDRSAFNREKFQKLSTILKKFKHSIKNYNEVFDTINLQTQDTLVVIKNFTTNTYVMLFLDINQSATPGICDINLAKASKFFLELEKQQDGLRFL